MYQEATNSTYAVIFFLNSFKVESCTHEMNQRARSYFLSFRYGAVIDWFLGTPVHNNVRIAMCTSLVDKVFSILSFNYFVLEQV